MMRARRTLILIGAAGLVFVAACEPLDTGGSGGGLTTDPCSAAVAQQAAAWQIYQKNPTKSNKHAAEADERRATKVCINQGKKVKKGKKK